ncbi:MAG: hypothetical protein ACJ79A_13105 [Gemmatimonadaceae bacterium]
MRKPIAAPDGLPRTAYVDFLLRFVLEQSGGTSNGIAGRLDAFERTLVALTRPWRAESLLAPARELRASSETLDALLTWAEGDEHPQGRELERLGVFASGAVEDQSVPEGWVRIRLM